jgi:hypothetical protein
MVTKIRVKGKGDVFSRLFFEVSASYVMVTNWRMLTVNKYRWYYLSVMKRSKLLFAAIILLLLGTAIPAAATTAIVSSENELQQSVIALDRVRHQAVHDLAGGKQNAAFEEIQQKDYEKFIVFLTVKIDEYCQQLRTESGEAAVKDLPCPEGGQAFGAAPLSSVQTSEEQVKDLERLFVDSLEQFDDKLLKEEERLSARQPRDRETGYSNGGSQGQGSEGGAAGTGQDSGQESGSNEPAGSEGTAGQGQEDREMEGTGTAGETGGSATTAGEEGAESGGSGADSGEGAGPKAGGSGAGQSAGSSSRPGNVELDTGDDDVVARQLREAAEKETDPELKRKLWEEYRKYKEGVR